MPTRLAVTADAAALRERFGEVEWEQRIGAGSVFLVEDDDGDMQAYAILDGTFFGRTFVQRLFVRPGDRRQGVGSRLLAVAVEGELGRVFTSTNLSNASMHQLLQQAGWVACGLVHGLDEGDPEVFYFLDHG